MFLNRKSAKAEDIIAKALNDPSLQEQAKQIRVIANDRDNLAGKATAILNACSAAQTDLAAKEARFMQTLDMADFEAAVEAEQRAAATARLQTGGRLTQLFPTHPQATCALRWRERYPDTAELAETFMTEVTSRLKAALLKSEQADETAAETVGIEPSDSAATRQLRTTVKNYNGTSFVTAEYAARELFN